LPSPICHRTRNRSCISFTWHLQVYLPECRQARRFIGCRLHTALKVKHRLVEPGLHAFLDGGAMHCIERSARVRELKSELDLISRWDSLFDSVHDPFGKENGSCGQKRSIRTYRPFSANVVMRKTLYWTHVFVAQFRLYMLRFVSHDKRSRSRMA
jgi:hypothetical protein